MWKRQWLKGRKGQSIVEYLVIVTVVIAAILLIRGTVAGNMNTLFTNAATQTGNAAGQVGGATPE